MIGSNWGSGLEERDQLDVSFVSCLLDAGPVQMALARVLPPLDRSHLEVDFPRAPHPPNSHQLRGKFAAGDRSLFCFIALEYEDMQPRRSAP